MSSTSSATAPAPRFRRRPSRVETYDGSGAPDAVLVRLNLALAGTNQLTYGTFLGGSGDEVFASLALDASDQGLRRRAHDLQRGDVPRGRRPSPARLPRAAPTCSSPSSTPPLSGAASLVFATRINGFYTDIGRRHRARLGQPAVDRRGGVARSSPTPNAAQDFPLVNTLQTQRSGNGAHAAVVQLNAAGNGLLLSSLIGGNAGSGGPSALAITAGDEVWVGGDAARAARSQLALVTPFQANYGGGDADATLQRIGRQADLTITKTVDKPAAAVHGAARRVADVHDRRQQRDRRHRQQRGRHRQPAGRGRLRVLRAPRSAASAAVPATTAPSPFRRWRPARRRRSPSSRRWRRASGPGQVWTNTATVDQRRRDRSQSRQQHRQRRQWRADADQPGGRCRWRRPGERVRAEVRPQRPEQQPGRGRRRRSRTATARPTRRSRPRARTRAASSSRTWPRARRAHSSTRGWRWPIRRPRRRSC